MKIFVSSVRVGLEEERRALPGLIRALGHEPVVFEDFGALSEPSREACLRAVAESDVYLLLLGPNYGYKFPETGQSATHDEWAAAVAKGVERRVFHKANVGHDSEQGEFVKMVGEYAAGSFWADYTDVADLMTKVTVAIKNLEAAPSPLTYERLVTPPDVEWKDDWEIPSGFGRRNNDAFVELHVVPLVSSQRPSRRMRELPEAIVSGMRTFGALPFDAGVEVQNDDNAVTVTIPAPDDRRRGGPREHRLGGVRVAKSGQVSIWFEPPGDQMGTMLNRDDLASALTDQLRLAGALRVLPEDRFVIFVGLGGSTMMVSLGKATGMNRSQASMGLGSGGPTRTIPDESVSAAALEGGASDVARVLATDS